MIDVKDILAVFACNFECEKLLYQMVLQLVEPLDESLWCKVFNKNNHSAKIDAVETAVEVDVLKQQGKSLKGAKLERHLLKYPFLAEKLSGISHGVNVHGIRDRLEASSICLVSSACRTTSVCCTCQQ